MQSDPKYLRVLAEEAWTRSRLLREEADLLELKYRNLTWVADQLEAAALR